MEMFSLLCCIAVGYGILLFFDLFFRSCLLQPYISFLHGTGLSIKFLQIKWETSACNRYFLRWGNAWQTKWNQWFTWGLYMTLMLLPAALLLLATSVWQSMGARSSTTFPTSGIPIEPLVPGVNLPLHELGYYSLSLIVCSVVHELGHAIASVREDVHIVSVGITLWFVLPLAYVQLSTDRLHSLPAWRMLRILCAGVWHNLVLSLLAYLAYVSLPVLFALGFRVNQGVVVTSILATSPLLGARGLAVADIIVGINGCAVRSDGDFYSCLKQAHADRQGFCVHTDLVHDLDESVPLHDAANGVLDCCDAGKSESVCFEYVARQDGVLEIPPHVCLPARIIVETAQATCGGLAHAECPSSTLHCIRPMLDNVTTLMKIARLHNANVVYIGHPGDLVQTLTVSPFIPKHWLAVLVAPDVVLKFCEYLIIISLGLAVVNVLPCLFMDGQHISHALLEIIMQNTMREKTRLLSMFICLTCTLLLLFHCLYVVWQRLR